MRFLPVPWFRHFGETLRPAVVGLRIFMHASRLVELASAAASFHHALLSQPIEANDWAANQFWVVSRGRINEWSQLLKQCQRIREQPNGLFQPRSFWRSTAPTLEEVFLSEVCTRVWCATLAIVDKRDLHGELAPVARSVFIATLEVRRRALRLLLFARGLPGIETASLNSLRHQCEVWTDGLLAQLSSVRLAQQFGFDKRRIRRSADSIRGKSARIATSSRAALQTSMRYGLATRRPATPVCPEHNCEFATYLLACFPSSGFDGSGIPSPFWAVDSFQSDLLSVEILEDLCGNSSGPRYDVPGGLMDR